MADFSGLNIKPLEVVETDSNSFDLNDPIFQEALQWGECVDKIISDNLPFKSIIVKTYITPVSVFELYSNY